MHVKGYFVYAPHVGITSKQASEISMTNDTMVDMQTDWSDDLKGSVKGSV
jgi:hypothetical protein